jgi:hypothetical protein
MLSPCISRIRQRRWVDALRIPGFQPILDGARGFVSDAARVSRASAAHGWMLARCLVFAMRPSA